VVTLIASQTQGINSVEIQMLGILLPQLSMEFALDLTYLKFGGIETRISAASLGLRDIPQMEHTYVHGLTNS